MDLRAANSLAIDTDGTTIRMRLRNTVDPLEAASVARHTIKVGRPRLVSSRLKLPESRSVNPLPETFALICRVPEAVAGIRTLRGCISSDVRL